MITTCRKCHQEEEHSLRPNGKPQSSCKKCKREYSNQRYADNKDALNKKRHNQRKAERQKIREFIIGLKESTPCADCDEFYPYYVMDFDHVSGEKEFNISTATRSQSLKKVKKEIEKCEIVCSNCHRERTHKRNPLAH